MVGIVAAARVGDQGRGQPREIRPPAARTHLGRQRCDELRVARGQPCARPAGPLAEGRRLDGSDDRDQIVVVGTEGQRDKHDCMLGALRAGGASDRPGRRALFVLALVHALQQQAPPLRRGLRVREFPGLGRPVVGAVGQRLLAVQQAVDVERSQVHVVEQGPRPQLVGSVVPAIGFGQRLRATRTPLERGVQLVAVGVAEHHTLVAQGALALTDRSRDDVHEQAQLQPLLAAVRLARVVVRGVEPHVAPPSVIDLTRSSSRTAERRGHAACTTESGTLGRAPASVKTGACHGPRRSTVGEA